MNLNIAPNFHNILRPQITIYLGYKLRRSVLSQIPDKLPLNYWLKLNRKQQALWEKHLKIDNRFQKNSYRQRTHSIPRKYTNVAILFIVGNKKECFISIHMSMPIINVHMKWKIIYTKVYKFTEFFSFVSNKTVF